MIVGSGITGASIARFLAADPRASNLSIVLLEAREVCWGATGRNGGHCQPLLFDRTTDVAAFELKNVEAVKSYIEENNVPCEWRTVTGCRTFWTKEAFDAARSAVQKMAKEDSDLAAKVQLIEPGDSTSFKKHRVKSNASGATLTEGAGQLWPYKYVTFIVEKLINEGRINVQTNTPVTKIEKNGSTGGQTLTTPRGKISARHVMLATNGYTSHLLKDFADVIVPVRCEMSALQPPQGSERLSDSYGMVGFEGGGIEHDDYLIQRPFYDSPNGDGSRRGGHLMFGGGRSFAKYDCVGETDDDIVDPGEADYLRRALLHMLELGGKLEGLTELKASHQWTGIKGYSRDNMPWVGKIPEEQGLWLCGAYTGHGMPNASLCAKALVDMVLADEAKVKYEEICEQLVETRDLPKIYLLTAKRLQDARKLPSVMEQDAAGLHNAPAHGGSKCLAM